MAKKPRKPKPESIGMYFLLFAFSLNLMAAITLVPMASATAENPTCVELGTCMFANDPLNVMLMPFDSIFGGLSIVIFWSLIVGILWLRTENPMLVGLVGIVMCASYLSVLETQNLTPSVEFEGARLIGSVLFALSLGITIYHILSSRIHAAPQ